MQNYRYYQFLNLFENPILTGKSIFSGKLDLLENNLVTKTYTCFDASVEEISNFYMCNENNFFITVNCLFIDFLLQ